MQIGKAERCIRRAERIVGGDGLLCERGARILRVSYHPDKRLIGGGIRAASSRFSLTMPFRRIATRYDKLARNFLAAVCLVATICYWL